MLRGPDFADRYGSDVATSVSAINRYFDRNHSYRATAPREFRFLAVNEHFTATSEAEQAQILDPMRSGTYAWTPWSAAPNAMLYFDGPPGGLSVQQGYDVLSGDGADFFVGEAHGWWAAHGRLALSWAQTAPIHTSFFWSDGCAVADLDHPDNFLSAALYNPNSMVVAAKGTTNNSGGLGTNAQGFFGHNIATSMSGGRGLRDALVDHVNVPLLSPWSASREFHFGTIVLLGDPTLGVAIP